jgi:hypothetical protein
VRSIATFESHIPRTWRHLGPRFWWYAVFTYLLRLNQAERDRTSALARSLGLLPVARDANGVFSPAGGNIGGGDGGEGEGDECMQLGMHIRLGDRLVHDARLNGPELYVQAAVLVANKMRICGVLVATDDADVPAMVLPELRRKLHLPDDAVRLLPSHVDRPDYDVKPTDRRIIMGEWMAQSAKDKRIAFARDTIDVVEMLSETNVVVGLCASNVVGAIVALQYMKGRARHLPVVVDYDDCANSADRQPIVQGFVPYTALVPRAARGA